MMTTIDLFYATNRRHQGKEQMQPTGYGTDFSRSGLENLRFGRLSYEADKDKINAHLQRRLDKQSVPGDGESLSEYLSKCAKKSSDIRAYEESINADTADKDQPDAVYGSKLLFEDLREEMLSKTDVVIYIHGFNVSWNQAVGAATALQLMLNSRAVKKNKKVLVFLFSWPSDGKALPYVSYKSDRTEASTSGKAVGRGLLKVRDYLTELKNDVKRTGKPLCEQSIHLLCHSMGNYVLQNTLKRLREHAAGKSLPRIFEHVFMCAPDVDDDVLEAGKAMHDVHQITRTLTVYHNKGDLAMYISDYTKGHPDRLGHEGAARPGQVHRKIHQVDCSRLVTGLIEHSYYLWGPVNADIRQSIDAIDSDVDQDDTGSRQRVRHAKYNNVWILK